MNRSYIIRSLRWRDILEKIESANRIKKQQHYNNVIHIDPETITTIFARHQQKNFKPHDSQPAPPILMTKTYTKYRTNHKNTIMDAKVEEIIHTGKNPAPDLDIIRRIAIQKLTPHYMHLLTTIFN